MSQPGPFGPPESNEEGRSPRRGSIQQGESPSKKALEKKISPRASPEKSSPLKGSPEKGSPAMGSPEKGSPALGSPQKGSPAPGSPEKGSPAQGSPEKGSPALGSPQKSSPKKLSSERTGVGRTSPDRTSPERTGLDSTVPEGLDSDKKSSQKGSPQKAGSQKALSPKAGSERVSPERASPERPSPGKTTPGGTSPGRAGSEKVGVHKEASGKKGSARINSEKGSSMKGASHRGTEASKARPSAGTTSDLLNTEFIYYSAVLRHYAPILTREYDKMTVHLWMKKLFGPEYHSTVLKPKRNKYLLYLTITIYNNEAYGIFRQEPPCGVLSEIKDISFDKDFPQAAWELEKQWEETVENLPEPYKQYECYLHSGDCPEVAENIKAVADAEFQYYLWLARPYVGLLTDPTDKTMVACWIQLLCGIAPDPENCIEMKELRNEYMQALLGYVHDLRVEGPFRLIPPSGPVPPLSLVYEGCEEEGNIGPSGREAEEFLAGQPLPDNGAFAYINVTGELFGNY